MMPAIASKVLDLAQQNPELVAKGLTLVEQLIASGHPDPGQILDDIIQSVVSGDLAELAAKAYPVAE